MTALPVYLVRGDQGVLVADAIKALVTELAGGGEPSLAMEELSGDEYTVGALVDAAQTPPFFGDRRIVVARDVGRFSTHDVEPLVAYLRDPMPTTSLVLVAGGGQVARPLVEAVRKTGHVVDAGVPGGKGRSTWLAARLKAAPVRLDGRAAAMVGDHLGEDVDRLGSLMEMLAAAYGPGSRIGPDELVPFLGGAGSVAPWELTDAIDRGDAAVALAVLRRLTGPGGRHPLVILATLHTHFARMLRLDGAEVADEAGAAAVLGMTGGSTYPAKKALVQVRRLGHAPVARAIHLLAEADLALKGAVEWPAEVVLEVLVARLSALARSAAGARPRSGGRAGA
ncbi:MAG TPA: DNA polymerase III subunit delta [Acidimicrobiales bacterium]|jgi:DNA polymerase-3 subunit delta|nr:DNA polymerase III subunit delta [Acidimicrobiales bacterium]